MVGSEVRIASVLDVFAAPNGSAWGGIEEPNESVLDATAVPNGSVSDARAALGASVWGAIAVPDALASGGIEVLDASVLGATAVPGGRGPDERGPGRPGGRLVGLPSCAVGRTMAGRSAAQEER